MDPPVPPKGSAGKQAGDNEFETFSAPWQKKLHEIATILFMKKSVSTFKEVKKILKEHKPDLDKLLRKKFDLVRKSGIRSEIRKIILKEVVYI